MCSWPVWCETQSFHTSLTPQLAFIRQNLFLIKKKRQNRQTMLIAHHSWVLYKSHGDSFLSCSSLIQCGRILILLWRQHCQIGSHWTWLAPRQILVSLRSGTDFSYLRTQCVSLLGEYSFHQNYFISWCNWQLCDTVLHGGLVHPACY